MRHSLPLLAGTPRNAPISAKKVPVKRKNDIKNIEKPFGGAKKGFLFGNRNLRLPFIYIYETSNPLST
jgi:guanyl-specific ribonuclease Sa